MPLHDRKDERSWDGVHLLWLAQLLELPLALDQDQVVVIDLETTYHEAARRVYLD